MRNNSISTNINNNNNENINFGLIAAVFFALWLSDFRDKSQINIVTMTAIYNIYGIIFGSTFCFNIYHNFGCFIKKLITEEISPKKLLFIGGLIFLAFCEETLYSIYSI